MAETSSSLRKSKPQKVLTDSDMAAAQQLMQLSGDDDDNNMNDNKMKKEKNIDEEIDQNQGEITSAKIEEIFGKEEETFRPKKRKYRSLVRIYMTTKPMNVRHGKKMGY